MDPRLLPTATASIRLVYTPAIGTFFDDAAASLHEKMKIFAEVKEIKGLKVPSASSREVVVVFDVELSNWEKVKEHVDLVNTETRSLLTLGPNADILSNLLSRYPDTKDPVNSARIINAFNQFMSVVEGTIKDPMTSTVPGGKGKVTFPTMSLERAEINRQLRTGTHPEQLASKEQAEKEDAEQKEKAQKISALPKITHPSGGAYNVDFNKT